jgi:hypothetical protein
VMDKCCYAKKNVHNWPVLLVCWFAETSVCRIPSCEISHKRYNLASIAIDVDKLC